MALNSAAVKPFLELANHAGVPVNRDGKLVSFAVTGEQMNAWLNSTPLMRAVSAWMERSLRAAACRREGYRKNYLFFAPKRERRKIGRRKRRS